MKIILKWLNNNFLPISYKLWKEDKETIYPKLNLELRKDWVNAQLSVFSGMWLPVMLLFLGVFVGSLINPNNRGLLLPIFFLYFLVYIFLSMHHIDKYIDEKYLELSAKK